MKLEYKKIILRSAISTIRDEKIINELKELLNIDSDTNKRLKSIKKDNIFLRKWTNKFREILNDEDSHMYLFFKTETTGLPIKWEAPITELSNWPRMIRIAWILCDKNGKRIEFDNYIIKPENFTISKDVSKIYGITNEQAINEGEILESVLNRFNEIIKRSDYIISHNIKFEERILESEMLRMGVKSNFNKKQKLCTMQASTDYYRLSGSEGCKPLTLSQLHIKLFGKDYEDTLDTLAYIKVILKCFWQMRKIKLIPNIISRNERI